MIGILVDDKYLKQSRLAGMEYLILSIFLGVLLFIGLCTGNDFIKLLCAINGIALSMSCGVVFYISGRCRLEISDSVKISDGKAEIHRRGKIMLVKYDEGPSNEMRIDNKR